MTEPPVDAPRREDAPEPVDEALRCWRCGSPHEPFQEYCLECGARLVPLAGDGETWRREVWTRDSPFWFWATFLALLLIALGAGAIVLAATRDDEPRDRREAGRPTTSVIGAVPPVTTTELPDTVEAPPMTDATVPTLPPTTQTDASPLPPPPPATTPPPPTPPPAAGATGQPIDWPSARSGYTIVLRSVPHGRGRAVAEREARRAIDAGLPSVGVLDSSDYSSLVAGYYVVFTGVYDTEREAVSALPRARQANYPVAYVREITA